MPLHLPLKDDLTYWKALQEWGKKESDGCTGVHDYYVEACWEHDWHYRFGVTMYGEAITCEEANARFRDVIQMLSRWKRYSPLSWIRYYGVSVFGKRIWKKWRGESLKAPFILPLPDASGPLPSAESIPGQPAPSSLPQ